MTKTKSYTYGPHTFKAYCKPVGQGWEVGFTHKGQNYFVGNFTRKTEVTKWWSLFNKEIVAFSKKFEMNSAMPVTWYCNFLSNHLYTTYFTWLDKVFNKHQTTFKKSYTRDFKRFQTMKKRTSTETPAYYLKAV